MQLVMTATMTTVLAEGPSNVSLVWPWASVYGLSDTHILFYEELTVLRDIPR